MVDDAGIVTHATPLEDSKLAYLVADPLPIEFAIVKDETTKVVPEAVEIDDFASAEDFGYTTFSFDIVETISFQIAVFAYDSIADNFELTTSSVEISGDSTTTLFDQDIPDSTSRIVVRRGFAQYTVKVTKDGYTSFVKSFTAQELLLYKADHILIVKLFERSEQEKVNRCIQFDGTDDYINLGNIYDSLQLPFTVSAWVNIDQSVPYVFPIFVSQDNAPLYNGFWFCITKTNVFVEYGDGRGQNNPAFRKGKSAYVSSNLSGSWIYVTAVVRGAYDIDLYVNGVNVGGEWTGESAFPMASNYPYDVAKLGTIFQNDQTWSFKGLMDDVSVWNRSLSPAEVMDFMNHKFTGIESGLIGHWNFDEESGDTILDKSPYHHNGIINGSAERVISTVPGH